METTDIEKAAVIVFEQMMDTDTFIAFACENGFRINSTTVHYFRGSDRGPKVHVLYNKPFYLRCQVLEWFASKEGQKYNIAKNIADLQALAQAAAAKAQAAAAKVAPAAPASPTAAPATAPATTPAATAPAPAKARKRAKAVPA